MSAQISQGKDNAESANVSMKNDIVHPKELLAKERNLKQRFDLWLAVKITKIVGTMNTAYLFSLLALVSLPAVLSQVDPKLAHVFPHWLIGVSLIALVAWIAQTFFQLVLLPIIMVGQNVIQGQQAAKADADHQNLLLLLKIQEEQLEILKKLDK